MQTGGWTDEIGLLAGIAMEATVPLHVNTYGADRDGTLIVQVDCIMCSKVLAGCSRPLPKNPMSTITPA